MCDCTPYMVNGVIYGMGLSVIIFTGTYLIIDAIQERRARHARLQVR